MTQEKNYLQRKEVVAQLAGLISATNYARSSEHDCLDCIPSGLNGIGPRGPTNEEYDGVVRAVEKLGLHTSEVNQELQIVLGTDIFRGMPSHRQYSRFYMDHLKSFGSCFRPDTLCEVVAGIMDKKGLLK